MVKFPASEDKKVVSSGTMKRIRVPESKEVMKEPVVETSSSSLDTLKARLEALKSKSEVVVQEEVEEVKEAVVESAKESVNPFKLPEEVSQEKTSGSSLKVPKKMRLRTQVDKVEEFVEEVVEETPKPKKPKYVLARPKASYKKEEVVESVEEVASSEDSGFEDFNEVVDSPVEDSSELVTPVNTEDEVVDVDAEPSIDDLDFKTGDGSILPNLNLNRSQKKGFDLENVSPKAKTIGLISGGVLLLALLGAIGFNMMNGNTQEAKASPQSSVVKKSSSSSSSEEESLSYLDQLKKDLNARAKSTGVPYNLTVTDIGGGYLLGATVYNPDDEVKRYTDYSLTKPEVKAAVVEDETAAKIEEELKSKLPTINETITVKDGSKVSFETYILNDEYVTICLYGDKPFAYVTSDKDLNMVNHVTTYYVSDVAKS